MTCLEAALEYLQMGWSVIPVCPPGHEGVSPIHVQECKKRGKTCTIRWHEYQKRLPRASEVRTWWEWNPQHNVGIILGKVSGVVAIDVDGGDEGLDVLEQISGGRLIGEDIQFKTPGGGLRLLYRIPPGVTVHTKEVIQGKGRVELLGEGHQTVMPPSLHLNGGRYEWL